MKVTKEHFVHMQAAIRPLDLPEHRQAYKTLGYSDKRYRWDLMRAAGLVTFICDVLYKQGCNDDHIDTALRRIVPPIK